MHTRRHLLSLGLAAAIVAGCATPPALKDHPPIVFMHGNGDSAAVWQTTIWRFESNGWPSDRLLAADQPYPLAPDEDAIAKAGHAPSGDAAGFLRYQVEKALARSGASKVVLVGNSRGGNTIRNFVQNMDGDRVVSQVILGGNPAHGIWAIPGFREGSEFSALSPFLKRLNQPKNAAGDEVTPGIRWMTIRSDGNDKYAQPDGLWIGKKGTPTNVGYDSPALKGATNVVLPRIDHRETSFSPEAFAVTWKFLTGTAPRTTKVIAHDPVELSGRVTGLGFDPLDPKSGGYSNNLALVGARVALYPVDASGRRSGPALLEQTIGADGRWGPVRATPDSTLEFVVSAPGYATTHIYRSAFPRSSSVVNLRPERIADTDRDAKAIVIFTRPRGYFDAERDTMRLDGSKRLPGVTPSGAGVSSAKLKLASDAQRAISGEFNGETVTGLTWPTAGDHITLLELTY